MKKSVVILITAALLSVLGGCEFIMGRESPAENGGNLSVSFGTVPEERAAITAGADLPKEVLDSLRYELILTGPGGEPFPRTVPVGAETLKLTVAIGEWRIDARAYKKDGFAGSGSRTFTVVPGSNSIRVPMKINGGYFDITLSSADNGTVEADLTQAFPETTVALTLTPDANCSLKSGSLRVLKETNDEIVPVKLVDESDLTYTFTMPAENVTVTAVFIPSSGFILDGPEDPGINITVKHSADGILEVNDPPEISWPDGESLTFTVETPGYSGEAENLRWLVNGELQSATGNSIVIKAKLLTIRAHTLTVLILKDDLWYSWNIKFEVVN
jgi:hypothetical protein